ncbi:ABC transporter substrate-binding protein [Paenibacillus lycopersici]|uniref:ABC transporter substrate-binding protein n=1 Tax=Paenibacillus lycopersici TaxID=2704462 RepID=A0A6C0FTV6_9BACL|nr:ABC transporter substrate-binding protein [Paenibacillus lycopersici]QHT58754.1 ABC transporter substrate-binding protein [Paenibacillus lycopersici]
MKTYSRFTILIAACFLLAVVLSACGASNDANTAANSTQAANAQANANAAADPKTETASNGEATSNTAASAGADTAASEATTRVFKDYEGHEVTIPTHPQRILANQLVGHLLAVGVKPVGTTTSQLGQLSESSFLKPLGLTEGIEDLGDTISLEKALSLKPDLIILQSNDQGGVQNYDQYAKIAPTVVISYGSKTMFEQLREIADIAGVPDQAEQWISQYEAKAAKYREELAGLIPPNTTFSVMEAWPKGQIELFGNLFGRGTFSLYNSLQLQAPAKVQEAVMDKEPSYLGLSLETLPDYAADYIFLSVFDWQEGGDNAKLQKEFEKEPVWRSLPAVKQGHVFHVNVNDFLPGDPLSIEKQLDEQARMLLEAFKK